MDCTYCLIRLETTREWLDAPSPKKKHEIPKSGSITVVIRDSGQASNRGLRPMQFTVVTAHLNEEDVGMKYSMHLLHV